MPNMTAWTGFTGSSSCPTVTRFLVRIRAGGLMKALEYDVDLDNLGSAGDGHLLGRSLLGYIHLSAGGVAAEIDVVRRS